MHIGHFYLTELLLPTLKASEPSRIINVSSEAHDVMVSLLNGPLELGFLSPPEAEYSRMTSYGIAKLANVWHAKALARRLAGSGVCAVSLHPGKVSTDIGRNVCCGTCCFKVFGPCCFRGVDAGAATTMYCCLAPEVTAASGGYFADAAEAQPSANACNEAHILRHEDISFEVLRQAGFAIDRV
jgi:NAD(P)-dependent dehydrogenase (short-subunit alcohol dehydrogenase family)